MILIPDAKPIGIRRDVRTNAERDTRIRISWSKALRHQRKARSIELIREKYHVAEPVIVEPPVLDLHGFGYPDDENRIGIHILHIAHNGGNAKAYRPNTKRESLGIILIPD